MNKRETVIGVGLTIALIFSLIGTYFALQYHAQDPAVKWGLEPAFCFIGATIASIVVAVCARRKS
jgi:hypothetical protein